MTSTILAGIVAAAAATAAPPPTVDQALRATLLQMLVDDQQAGHLTMADAGRQPTKEELLWQSELHRKNGELIRKIVQEHGWPGRSLVGEDGAHAAWIVVQHMDLEVDFQRSCLALMQEAYSKGEVPSRDLAYLTDRVLTHEGRKQMYGTQGGGVTSKEDEDRVNANRAALGLPPWRLAAEQRADYYANQERADAAKAP